MLGSVVSRDSHLLSRCMYILKRVELDRTGANSLTVNDAMIMQDVIRSNESAE